MMTKSRLSYGALALLLLSAGSALAQSPAPAGARVHLARPGTDIEADTLIGNLNAQTYTVSGNVVIHSDPKVDRAVALSESTEPFTLSADAVDVERKALRYAAKGHVHFVQGAREGRADTALLDEKSHDLDLIGHAHVADGGQQADADRMHYNTLDKHFTGTGNVKLIAPVPTPPPGSAPTSTPAPKKRGLKLPF